MTKTRYPALTQKGLGLVLLFGPSALFIASMLLYSVSRFIVGLFETRQNSEALLGNGSPYRMITNPLMSGIINFSFAVAVPFFFIGIILLITRKKNARATN